jgi:signal peptidase I
MVDDGAQADRAPRSLQENLGHELLKVALILLFVVLPIRLFIAQPFIVSGSSMDPTFENKDYLIVDQLSLKFDTPERFDVVIFQYPYNKSKYFIKRIIGLPGERIVVSGGDVMVYPVEAAEPELIPAPYAGVITTGDIDIRLGESQYFVLGDNRGASSDSRVWGPLERELIVGKPLLRLFPAEHASFAPGKLMPLEESEESNE